MFRRIILTVLLIVLISTLAGCNTVQGLGKDIEWTGQKGEEILSGR
jgi:predicted small secreted protein